MKEFLTRIDLFRGLTSDVLALLEPETHRVRFSPGSKLYVQGGVPAAVYVIISGRVRTERRHPDIQGAVVLAEHGPGDAVGGGGVLDAEPHSHTAIALEPTETVELPAAGLVRLLAESAEMSSRFMNAFKPRRPVMDGTTVPAPAPAQDR